ncbi:class II fructose-bisphosphate aldolase [Clostridium beijerinckii]|uniref:class II fructose-bisphosphate aldolase n=1 Tax=Clostridium beijerinckii TaxID=1520 RepID=UPI0012B16BBB|nr:class II fructose-bisphosphate aldolase [Clostridium beijerinckii]MRY42704.1 ketose-bisphosphate aldolase [Parabacteroides distasonis]MZK52085.1 ketose-bisphosphate aldolase [Clostridium beijerinckii]MZK60226.1 ketose-bisphosphate aldolase [Clostridium beijerinckii]MZK70511.1 ketose-bisphosphate aldolase [Clostridium beijerinckii]MZK75813.1 ketose-bisphosphate aldolase [Clostridium beijerinckii]
MLVTMKEILKIAEEKDIAVGAFNTPNLESIMAVLNAAEKYETPVMITHAELHEPIMPLEVIAPIMLGMAKSAKIPVCVHLDHCDSLDYLERALELGFTSVMYDGSLFSYEKNVEDTKKAVELAKKFGASVEAEIGILGGRESGAQPSEQKVEDMYTDPDLAYDFVQKTKIDALAASFGTAHGFYKTKPKLDFDRIEKINELIDIPLVMHGGSGVSPEDYTTAIRNGVRKINYYSYMARSGVDAIKDLMQSTNVEFFHDLVTAATKRMQEDAEKAIKIFSQGSKGEK